MSLRPKQIVVIGAGATGLTAVKCCLEEDLQVVCFERMKDFGGLWKYNSKVIDGQSSVIRSTIINTSKEMSAFSDFPPPAEFPNFMHHTKMLEYLRLYAENFSLLEHVRFGRDVISVTKSQDFEDSGQWVVRFKNAGEGTDEEEEEIVADGVMVCTGHHDFPIRPTFPGLETFQGRVMHSNEYRIPDEFEDKNVVVVGAGNSGVDMAVELSTIAKKVLLSSRRGTWVLPRVGTYGLPLDISLSKRITALCQDVLPFAINSFFFESMINFKLDHGVYCLKPNHRILSEHASTNDTLGSRILSGTVVIKGGIQRFTERGVVFDHDGRMEHTVDTVILATGYDVQCNFLQEKNVADRLYKLVFPLNLERQTLGFIGFVQPIGSLFPVAELQCRWFARVMSGKATLPPKTTMTKDWESMDRQIKEHYTGNRRVAEVSWIGYMDDISKQIGAKPDLRRILVSDPSLAVKCFFGPCVPYQYRIQGPHRWSGARHAIMTTDQRVLQPLKTKKLVRSSSKMNCPQSFNQIVFYRLLFALTILLIMGMFLVNYCTRDGAVSSLLFANFSRYLNVAYIKG